MLIYLSRTLFSIEIVLVNFFKTRLLSWPYLGFYPILGVLMGLEVECESY